MTIQSTTATMAVELTRHRFAVADFDRMIEAGILDRDSRVELIDGRVMDMLPVSARHARGVNRLSQAFVAGVDRAATVSIHKLVRLGDHDEPRPDVTLLRHRDAGDARALAAAEDVFLVAEVADGATAYEEETEAELYAHAGISEYWVMDIGRGHLLVHREPTEDGYATTRVYRRGERVSPLAFPDLTLAVDDILG